MYACMCVCVYAFACRYERFCRMAVHYGENLHRYIQDFVEWQSITAKIYIDTYCELQNNRNISTVFNGLWYQFTTEPRRSVFQLFCKSQYLCIVLHIHCIDYIHMSKNIRRLHICAYFCI